MHNSNLGLHQTVAHGVGYCLDELKYALNFSLSAGFFCCSVYEDPFSPGHIDKGHASRAAFATESQNNTCHKNINYNKRMDKYIATG